MFVLIITCDFVVLHLRKLEKENTEVLGNIKLIGVYFESDSIYLMCLCWIANVRLDKRFSIKIIINDKIYNYIEAIGFLYFCNDLRRHTKYANIFN